MKKLYALLIVAVIMTGLTVWAIMSNPFQTVAHNQSLPNWKPPFDQYIAGEGIITPAPNLVPLRPAESGQVVKTFVKVGDQVTKGQPLLQLNIQDLLADKLQLEATIQTALAEEKAAQSDFDYYREMYRKNQDKFISSQAFTHAQNLLAIARKKVAASKVALTVNKLRMERRTLTAPFNGQLIHFSVYAGMWLRADETPPDEILLAPHHPLQLRVELNQFDIIHFSPHAKAIAWLPNRPNQKIALTFNHVEPIIKNKTLISGRTTELTSTRVLTLVYDIQPTQLPLYTGEQFDVFIAAKP